MGLMRALLCFALGCAALVSAAPNDGFTSLMPKANISEFWIDEGGAPDTWRVEDGMIRCTGKPNAFLRSKLSYRNYILRAEWRFQKEGWVQKKPDHWPNAGFFINAGAIENTWPMSHEVQGHFGQAGSLFGVRGGTVEGAKRGPIDDQRPPFGSWDRYEITQQNGNIRVVLNGRLINEGSNAKPSEGNICIQSEGWPVDYRNIQIKVLP